MKTIGIGDIQKNTSIFNNLTESIEIVDKRRKKTIAVVYPVRKTSIVTQLSGKYRNLRTSPADLAHAKEAAMTQAMEEKYGSAD